MADPKEPRQFSTGRPVARVTNVSTGEMRVIVWDEANNEYVLNDYNFLAHEQSPTSETADGTLYPHVDGVRFHASLSWVYYHPDYAVTIPASIPGFTEHDFRWLLAAQIGTTHYVEFFPFDTIPMGTAPNSKYECRIISLSRTRDESNAWLWNCTMEVEGLRIITSAAEIPVV